MAKKEKKFTITLDVIKKLTRARGLQFTANEIGEILDTGIDPFEVPTTVVGGCVDLMTYEASSVDVTAVTLLDRFGEEHRLVTGDADGIPAQNLADFRELIERAADHRHGLVFYVKLGRIQQVVAYRCACPCDAEHASAHPSNLGDGGIADGLDRL